MRCTFSSGVKGKTALTKCWSAAALLLAGCTLTPAPSQPRPHLAPALDGSTAAQPIEVPRLESLEDRGGGRFCGQLVGTGETVRFDLWRAPAAGRPLVLLVPILAGGADLMDMVAERLFDRGFDVAWCDRVGAALTRSQRGPELEQLFLRTVLQQRLLLAWLHAPGNAPPSGSFVLGISLGGMVAVALAAHEPGLDGVAICLSGGDLETLLPHSGERRVQRWVDWRAADDGVGNDHLEWELGQWQHLEPMVMAASIPTDKVLFVAAGFDDVVPERNRDLLWEALGRPARLAVPLGHYSAALAIGPILSAAADHFAARIPTAAAPQPPANR